MSSFWAGFKKQADEAAAPDAKTEKRHAYFRAHPHQRTALIAGVGGLAGAGAGGLTMALHPSTRHMAGWQAAIGGALGAAHGAMTGVSAHQRDKATAAEKTAMMPSLNPLAAGFAGAKALASRAGARLAGTPNGQAALGALGKAKIYGKGMVTGGLLTAGGLGVAKAVRGANQGAMVPVPQQQRY